MTSRRFDIGTGFVRARECPDCGHTRCGEDCVCNCDAAHAEFEAAHLRGVVEEAVVALGPAWMHGGASLAEGIRRKTSAMERLAMEPPRRRRAKATLTIERMDGTEETTTFGGNR